VIAMNAMGQAAHIRLELSSRAENVPLVRQALSGLATSIGLSAADLNDIETAVTEACNNVSVHAYDGAEGPLTVELVAGEGTIVVTVRDHGVGLARDGVARVEFPSDVDGELAGIGVPSIKALARNARWSEPADGGTELEMIFSTDSIAWEDVDSAYSLTEPFPPDGGRFDEAIEVGMAPLSIAQDVLPRLLRVMAARAHFSMERHADVQRVGSAALLADPSMWFASGVHARLLARGDSLEVAIGPLSEEDVATVAVATSAIEPNLRVSAERLPGKPQRLLLRLDRGGGGPPNEPPTAHDRG
jgi:anti-sigma regulatory factor (Ser/Thr protein kinase)